MSIHINKIYTKGGDQGKTSLVGGARIFKGEVRLECYGTSDELNAHVGVLRTLAGTLKADYPLTYKECISSLKKIQNDLFDWGSYIANPKVSINDDKNETGNEQNTQMVKLAQNKITWLEKKIDGYTANLPALKSFTLPGGGDLNAAAHLARVVCRRWERLLWLNQETLSISTLCIKYANRLSDYFFAFSRWISMELGEEEYLWEKDLVD